MLKIVINNMWKNKSSVLASLLITMVTFLILAVSILTFLNIDKFTESISDNVTVRIILDSKKIQSESESDPQITEIKNNILKIENIDTSTIKFISKTEDIKRMIAITSKDNKVSPYEGLKDPDKNPLGNVYVVKVKDASKIEQTSNEIEKISNIKQVFYLSKEVKAILSIAKIVNIALISFFALLVVATFLLISNVIKLSINMRKEEIEIMRLVGASNQYIKTPFIIEGITISILSGAIISFVVLFLYNTFIEGNQILGVNLVSAKDAQNIVFTLTLIIGLIVGFVGSSSAIKKYLKI